MTPHCCPVCNGRGKVDNQFYNLSPWYNTTTPIGEEPCRSCSGTGVLWVDSTKEIKNLKRIYEMWQPSKESLEDFLSREDIINELKPKI